VSDKENNNIVHFEAEKILYDLEKQIKAIVGNNSEELEFVKIAKDILRGKLEANFEVDIESFLKR
jgi:hypothetical protein